MEILKIIGSSFFSIVALFVLTKLMGNRQMSQLSMFDYVNGITIGSIAAEAATALEGDFLLPLTAMVVYAAVTILITFIVTKSQRARRIISGRSVILFEGGKFRRKDMRRAQVDVGEFMSQCRINGCFSLSELECAVLEPNGRISFLLKADKRPAQPSDLGLTPPAASIAPTVILDGQVLRENLKHAGRDENWLTQELARLAVSLPDVMLGEVESDGTLSVYRMDEKSCKRDIFA